MIRACACRPVKEEEGAGPPKGSNSLSGRELRALMRSTQATDKGKQDNEPGSTKGEHTDKFLKVFRLHIRTCIWLPAVAQAHPCE